MKHRFRSIAPLHGISRLLTGTSHHAYRRDENGNVTIMSLFMMIMIIGFIGVSIDFMRAERNRTTLQHTLDRAVLAAADLDQQSDPSAVVQEYFAAAGLDSTISQVSIDEGLNYRTVEVSAGVSTHAPYLDLLSRWTREFQRGGEGRSMDDEGRLIALEECRATLTPADTVGAASENTYGVGTSTTGGNPSEIHFPDCINNEDLARTPLDNTSRSTISAVAQGAAEERVSNVEISMVLDVSGSMGWNGRMTNLRTAAKTFVDTVINDSNEGLVSVSLVPYDEGVSLGPNFYNAVRDEINVTHRHNYSHCLEFEDSEFDETGLRFNQTYEQMQHTRLYGSWGFQCSTNSNDDMTVFSQNRTALKNQIDALQPNGNTHTFLGMKWAAALLDPNFNPILDNLVDDGVVDNDFADRPAAFDDNETLKTIVLMTDGQNTSSYRVAHRYYRYSSHYVHWNNWGIMDYLNRYVHYSYHSYFYYTKYNGSQGDTLLSNVCDAAKNAGIIIWSIGFEVNSHAANEMEDCASSPSHFFLVEGIEITDAFSAIARQINQLRLTQ